MQSFCCSSRESSMARSIQPILDRVPEQDLPERLLDDLVPLVVEIFWFPLARR